MFAKETYIARRKALKEKMGSGLLLFLGNNLTGMNYADNTYLHNNSHHGNAQNC